MEKVERPDALTMSGWVAILRSSIRLYTSVTKFSIRLAGLSTYRYCVPVASPVVLSIPSTPSCSVSIFRCVWKLLTLARGREPEEDPPGVSDCPVMVFTARDTLPAKVVGAVESSVRATVPRGK